MTVTRRSQKNRFTAPLTLFFFPIAAFGLGFWGEYKNMPAEQDTSVKTAPSTVLTESNPLSADPPRTAASEITAPAHGTNPPTAVQVPNAGGSALAAPLKGIDTGNAPKGISAALDAVSTVRAPAVSEEPSNYFNKLFGQVGNEQPTEPDPTPPRSISSPGDGLNPLDPKSISNNQEKADDPAHHDGHSPLPAIPFSEETAFVDTEYDEVLP